MRLSFFEPRPRTQRGRGDFSRPSRRFLGLSASIGKRAVCGAMLSTNGEGLSAALQVEETLAIPLPDFHAERLESATSDAEPGLQLAVHAELVADLTDLFADLCSQLIGRAGANGESIWAIGLGELVVASRERGVAPRCVSLGDAAKLAAATGLAVIDGFPAADLVRRGCGDRLAALPLWLLLARHEAIETNSPRLLLELGRESRLTMLPPFSAAAGEGLLRRIGFARAPGLAALDRLTRALTGDLERYDPGGRLGAQGRLREEWLAPWLEYFASESAPEAISSPRHSANELHDALRSATAALAATLAGRIGSFIGGRFSEVEILLAGGGRRNGLLLRELAARMPAEAVMHPITEFGLRDESLAPATAAILAMFFVDRVAGNLPHLTGADGARVLGRLTPGNPATLRRLLQQMSARTPETSTLRDAI